MPAAGRTYDDQRMLRGAALASVLVLTASYVSVLNEVAVIVGGGSDVVPVALVTLLVASVVAALVSERTAISAALLLMLLGNLWYIQSTPATVGLLLDAWRVLLSDAVSLLTGLSVVQLSNAGAWAVGSVPAPVFLSWYLAVRRHYAVSAAIGLAPLIVLVLTGDAGTLVTLAGVLGAAGAVGFGDLERRGASIEQADALAVTFAAMAVLSMTVTVIPAGSGSPLSFHGASGVGGGQGQTIEGGVIQSGGEFQIQGGVELSPEVRFTVESSQPGYWRTGVYDKFTGDGWYRTGGTNAWDGAVESPPGSTETVEQVYEIERPTGAMPSVYQPVELSGDVADATQISRQGSLVYERAFQSGDSYRVTSLRPDAAPAQLRQTDWDYPGSIRAEYLQVPSNQPGRVGDLATDLTADADNPYDAAIAIERYLEAEKTYSLDIDRPDGNIADAFLFEMDAGYCTYYATTMTTMLREIGVPARMAVGYSTGQPVDDDRYVVRGLNAHAWVEVYFEGEGWVTFDPTPSDGRQQLRESWVQRARSAGNDAVDTDESRDQPPTQYENETASTPSIDDPDDDTNSTNTTDPEDTNRTNSSVPSIEEFEEQPDETGGPLSWLPPPDMLAVAAIALLGLGVLSRRTGHAARARRAIGVHRQGRGRTPREDVERAFTRLEYLLAREKRPRSPTETPREYVDRMAADRDDERIDQLRRLYERARYGDDLGPAEADEAVDAIDDLVAERTRWMPNNR
ncbi:Transglutaminase-like enzyme, putative cysteine protease [Natronoarchaeum philippinense]|uniref:Transglutaminase-like enzyme, putative cysteine protease n=2 Tax=Natronoarchaeum philippinense TaxID=558529 RepID=A0A285NS03_NATPI|nr:Transglutaminase-like enzyme, putative cysteine protease [Natronoarchaeum philippinense]